MLQRENRTLRLLVAIHDRLGASVLQGADAAAITAALADLVDRPVLLLDSLLRPTLLESRTPADLDRDPDATSLLWEPNDSYVGRVVQMMAGERRSVRLPPLPAWGVSHGCVLAPIVVADSTLGYLAILEPPAANPEPGTGAEAELLAAQHAASVYALALMRERLAAEVTIELRDELLEGLLLGQVADDQAALERARRVGYDDALSYRVLVLIPDNPTERGRPTRQTDAGGSATWRRRVLDSLAQVVKDRAPRAIVTRRRDELVVLAPDGIEPEPAELGKMLTRYATAAHSEWPLTVGLGEVCHFPKEIARSYSEARRAAEVALRFGRRGVVVTLEDIGLYRLIFHIEDRAELRAFVEQVIGAVLAYDRKHRTDFVRTIKTYLSNNNSLLATAKELYVHVNTAAYRIRRIQAISGLNFGKTDDCLMARVALMILDDEGIA